MLVSGVMSSFKGDGILEYGILLDAYLGIGGIDLRETRRGCGSHLPWSVSVV
jgi:hypothetical protein